MGGIMFRFPRMGLAIMAALAIVLTMAPAVSAHAADTDGGGVCDGDVKIVVFEHANMQGADDDLCFYSNMFNAVAWVGDPNFSVNNNFTSTIPQDDIGNRYLMAGFVSSISIRNDSSLYLCVRYYDDSGYGGWSESDGISPFEHFHKDFVLWHNDRYDSIKIYDYNC
jgi:hypothetical protein